MPISNEKEIVYLSLADIDSANLKVFLAHEFVHLITFNQKNKMYGVEEDTWLNEARADYSSTILGYDNVYAGSNLQQRVKDFIENPSDSIVDWTGTKYDYASVSLFMHYLVDHYGANIVSDSMRSKSVGIESIDYALQKSVARDTFAQIFTNWTIAVAVNDCSQNSKYCYSSQNLNSLRISPTLIFLPLAGDSSLSSTNTTKNWAGNWQKIIGGSGNLKLSFSNSAGLDFQVPYIVYDKSNNYSVNFLTLDANKKGEINIQDFGTKYNSLIIAPSLQSELSGFDGLGLTYPYSFTVSIAGKNSSTDQTLIQQLLAQIDSLKKQIAAILAQRQAGGTTQTNVCQIVSNLSYGMYNNTNVRCLQTFLKNQGNNLYSGLVTGYFGPLTKAAVIKFQQQNSLFAAGIVDEQTRAKINQMLVNAR
ncbi:MAG: peptidoglycan-binding domain-containing protein [Candidatus Staskawiczbacteria bacterium]|nr:peptidoglycan-binding domain-containing protein [Candidatus Staskawiczbacteria bacterium]